MAWQHPRVASAWLVVGILSVAGVHADDEAIPQVLEALCAETGRAGKPGFVVGFSRSNADGHQIFKKTCGLAELSAPRRLSTSTPFYLASLTKQFTAFAVLLLDSDGKLSLEDPVREHLPGFAASGDLRLGHLMHHTSGVREHWTVWRLSSFPGDDLDDIVTLLSAQRGLNFHPGRQFEYTNANYVLLAAIVQRVAGRPLPEFLRERVFEPLRMKDTAFAVEDKFPRTRAATGYVRDDAGYAPFEFKASDIVGDGGLYSSVDDLLRWSRELLAPTLGVAMERRIGTRVEGAGPHSAYGAGLTRRSWAGIESWEHGGGYGGASTYLGTFPRDGISIVVLANAGDLDAGDLFKRVREQVLEGAETGSTDPGRGRNSQADPGTYFGFVRDQVLIVETSIEGEKDEATLSVAPAGGTNRSYESMEDGTFRRVDAPSVRLRFLPRGEMLLFLDWERLGALRRLTDSAVEADRALLEGCYASPDTNDGAWCIVQDGLHLEVVSPRGDRGRLTRKAPSVHEAEGLRLLLQVQGEPGHPASGLHLYAPGVYGLPVSRLPDSPDTRRTDPVFKP